MDPPRHWETYCSSCEDLVLRPEESFKCAGTCGATYHRRCARGTKSGDSWKCQDCSAGLLRCFICASTDGVTIACSVSGCNKYYHQNCLESGIWPQSNFDGPDLICPSHVCHTCSAYNLPQSGVVYRTRVVKCVRCPTAYHAEDFCVAAGSIHVTSSTIVCSKHYLPKKSKRGPVNHHLNSSWCFICSSGGSLICCEMCPASFHAECLQVTPPEGSFYCPNCQAGKRPLYGEILWVKLGSFRWWPSQVLHPTQVPDNIDKLTHDVGEFVVQFCGSKEFAWMNLGRCFTYQEGDSDKSYEPPDRNTSSLDAAFRLGLTEAAALYDEYTAARANRESSMVSNSKRLSSLRPDPYIKIQTNKPYKDCPVYTANPEDRQVCDCNPNSDQPCSTDSGCLNRYLMWECSADTCPAGAKCHNMRFQRMEYPRLAVSFTSERGWGLYLKEDINKGDFVIEYVGELITTEEYKRRVQSNISLNHYYMTMDNQRVIDAGPKGNNARFMNHSCDPNCETQKWMVDGDTRIGLFARENILAGTELTFNYQFESVGDVKQKCLCGAKNCSGLIGERSLKEKPTTATNSPSSSNVDGTVSIHGKRKKSNRPKQRRAKLPPDEFCFRCYSGGQLFACKHKDCGKSYHLECVDMKLKPRHRWNCPWHYCVACGKRSARKCEHCSNAYCNRHAEMIKIHPVLGDICLEHKDDFGDLLKFYKHLSTLSESGMVTPKLKSSFQKLYKRRERNFREI